MPAGTTPAGAPAPWSRHGTARGAGAGWWCRSRRPGGPPGAASTAAPLADPGTPARGRPPSRRVAGSPVRCPFAHVVQSGPARVSRAALLHGGDEGALLHHVALVHRHLDHPAAGLAPP